jgi:hypothetical protein
LVEEEPESYTIDLDDGEWVQQDTEPAPPSSRLDREGGFFFAEPPPGSRPCGASRIPPGRVSRGPKSRAGTDPQNNPEIRKGECVVMENWGEADS